MPYPNPDRHIDCTQFPSCTVIIYIRLQNEHMSPIINYIGTIINTCLKTWIFWQTSLQTRVLPVKYTKHTQTEMNESTPSWLIRLN